MMLYPNIFHPSVWKTANKNTLHCDIKDVDMKKWGYLKQNPPPTTAVKECPLGLAYIPIRIMLDGFLGENSPKVGCTIRMDFRNKLLGLQFLVRPVFHLIFVSESGSDTSQNRIDVLVYWPDIKTHCQNHYHQEPEPTTQTWLKWVKSAAWGHQPKNLFHQDASLSQIFEIVKNHYPPSIIMIACKSRTSISEWSLLL